MSTMLLWIVDVMIALLCLFAGYIILKRLRRPFSERMFVEQKQLNERTGSSNESPPPSKEMGRGEPRWHQRYLWSVVLVVVCITLVYLEYKVPTTDIKAWSWGHWLQLLTVWGILAFLIVLNAEALGARTKMLQKALTVVVAMLFVGIPVGGWIMTPSVGAPQRAVQTIVTRALPQDAPDLPRAWNMDGTITDPSKWPRVQVPPHDDSVRVPNIFGGHLVWGGSGFKVHCVYGDGHEGIVGDIDNPCSDGNIVTMYAHNEGETLLYASYAYAKMNEK